MNPTPDIHSYREHFRLEDLEALGIEATKQTPNLERLLEVAGDESQKILREARLKGESQLETLVRTASILGMVTGHALFHADTEEECDQITGLILGVVAFHAASTAAFLVMKKRDPSITPEKAAAMFAAKRKS